MQKSLGYGLTGDTRYECMFFYYGATTRNGKGTLMESTLHVMGDYGLTVRPETIAAKPSANSQNPTEDIARLAGVRFANISEPRRGLVLNEAQIKSMTGNDTLNARFLHENSFDFKPQFKLYVNTNYLPAITDMTLFSSGRIVIIPFDRHFEEWEQEQNLKAEFSRPEAASAILNWLIEGYTLLQEEGFIQPKSVKDATMSYQHDSDKMELFVEEFLEEENDAECRTQPCIRPTGTGAMTMDILRRTAGISIRHLRAIGTVVRRRPRDGGEKTTLLTGYRALVQRFPLLRKKEVYMGKQKAAPPMRFEPSDFSTNKYRCVNVINLGTDARSLSWQANPVTRPITVWLTGHWRCFICPILKQWLLQTEWLYDTKIIFQEVYYD